MLKEHVIQSCRYLLLPVVRLLLKHGVTWTEFGELSKEAYVSVARQDYGIQGRPTNNSRVAMLTGLSRREVAHVRNRLVEGGGFAGALRGNRISQILSGWHSDEEFTDARGRPKFLPARGPKGSLTSLFKRYAGDLPHGAIRKELLQRGLIDELDNGHFRVLQRDYVYSKLDPDIVRRMGLALHDHATTLEHNLDEKRESAPRFEGIADNIRMSRRSFEAFRSYLEDHASAFLEAMDTWLSEHEIDSTKDTGTRSVRLGVGVYCIYDQSEQESEQ